MGDGAHAQFLLRALRIDMDPLMVARRIREEVDAVLVERDPLADADFIAFFGDVVSDRIENAHSLSPFPVW
jgi:hypothetical protein